MSGNTTNLGKQAQTGTLVADAVRTGSMAISGNITANSGTFSGALSAASANISADMASGTATIGTVLTAGSASIANTMVSANVVTGGITATSIGTGTLTATGIVTGSSFTQQYLSVGSAASPSSTLTITYNAAYNKYIFYNPVTNNTQYNKNFSITSFPDGFFANYSAVYTATFVATGPWSVGGSPITTADLYADESANTLSVNIITPFATPPVFTGTCYVKVVISFTKDSP